MCTQTINRTWVAAHIYIAYSVMLDKIIVLGLWWKGRKNEISTIYGACRRSTLKVKVKKVSAILTVIIRICHISVQYEMAIRIWVAKNGSFYQSSLQIGEHQLCIWIPIKYSAPKEKSKTFEITQILQ